MIVKNTHTIFLNAILNAVKNLTSILWIRFFTAFRIVVSIAFRIVVSMVFRIELKKRVCLCFRLLEKAIFVQIKHIIWPISIFYPNTKMV